MLHYCFIPMTHTLTNTHHKHDKTLNGGMKLRMKIMSINLGISSIISELILNMYKYKVKNQKEPLLGGGGGRLNKKSNNLQMINNPSENHNEQYFAGKTERPQ